MISKSKYSQFLNKMLLLIYMHRDDSIDQIDLLIEIEELRSASNMHWPETDAMLNKLIKDGYLIQLETIYKLTAEGYFFIDNGGYNELLIPTKKHQIIKNKQDKLRPTYRQLALINLYNDNPITRINANGIANKYGLTAKSSGEKLYQEYTKIVSKGDRLACNELSSTKHKNKIKLFESIQSFLKGQALKKAKLELVTIKQAKTQ